MKSTVFTIIRPIRDTVLLVLRCCSIGQVVEPFIPIDLFVLLVYRKYRAIVSRHANDGFKNANLRSDCLLYAAMRN